LLGSNPALKEPDSQFVVAALHDRLEAIVEVVVSIGVYRFMSTMCANNGASDGAHRGGRYRRGFFENPAKAG
jgi:hypothetical protein